MEGIIPAWGRILQGYRPNLSIEITRECPLRCPGCYAYGDEHLGGGQTLRTLADLKGQALIDGVLEVVAKHRPIHLSIVGGEPLVRFRELDVLLPRLADMGIYSAGRHQRGAADSRSVGAASSTCRSACRSTACSRSTTCGARRPPTIAS